MRRLLVSFLFPAALLALAACGASSSSSQPSTSPAKATTFSVHLKAPGHHPQVGKPWKITVTAKRSDGRPVRGVAFYEFLYGGVVVSKQYPAPSGGEGRSPYHFVGSFTDTLKFPKPSVGQPLTFRVVVRAGQLGAKHVDYPIKVVG